jgi:N-acetylgalactosamine kinase
LLQNEDVDTFGRVMDISHNGDRVVKWNGARAPYDSHATAERVERLIRASGQLLPLEESGAALWQQPGAYDCSTPEIDRMVDIAQQVPGVAGAQISGAGLGGCIMVLVETDRLEQLQNRMREEYYEPVDVEPQMFVCRPAGGSRVLTSREPHQ